jgi:hypothetical protein
MSDNQAKKASLAETILRKEVLILLVGVFFLCSGFYTGVAMQYFWGIMIMLGAVGLHFVGKKDWKKHWEEQEALKQHLDARRKLRQEGKDGE